jgi:hypothetical protein
MGVRIGGGNFEILSLAGTCGAVEDIVDQVPDMYRLSPDLFSLRKRACLDQAAKNEAFRVASAIFHTKDLGCGYPQRETQRNRKKT